MYDALRVIEDFYNEGRAAVALSPDALLFDDDRNILLHIHAALTKAEGR
jgi:hypothetical protein